MRPLKKIYLEITNACNMQCSFCPPGRREKGFISRANFETALEKLAGAAKILYFHLKGEPLLHPDLAAFLDLAHAGGFEVHLTTNGTLLASRLDDLRGQPALRRLNVSLHSLESLEKGQREGARREILRAVRILAKEDSLRVISLRLWNSSIPDGKSRILAPKISLHPADRFVWPRLADPGQSENEGEKPADFGPTGYCLALRDQAGILLDGTVVPCCLDGEGDIALGNLYDSDFETILASPRARALHGGFSRRQVIEPLCRSCGFRTRFE